MWYAMGGVMLAIVTLGGLGLRTVTRRFNMDLARVHDGPLTQRTRRNENEVCWSCDVSPAKSALGLCSPCELGLLPRT